MFAVTARYHPHTDVHAHDKTTGGLSAEDALALHKELSEKGDALSVKIIDGATGQEMSPEELIAPPPAPEPVAEDTGAAKKGKATRSGTSDEC